jgi:hydrogenase expression/formation protein HypC
MCLAVPGKIEQIDGVAESSRKARVNFSGVFKEVSLDCVPEAKEGDYVIVHAGFALSVLDEAEAQEVLDSFKALDQARADS